MLTQILLKISEEKIGGWELWWVVLMPYISNSSILHMRLVIGWGYKLMAMFMTELLAGIITSTFNPWLPVLLTQVCPILAVQILVNAV